MDLAMWALVAGFIGARFFHVVFYGADYYVAHPLDVFKVWQGGMSSLGGFVGAGIGLWLFAKKRHFSWKEFVPYCDVAAVSLWLGWGIGRLGCFLIHDHPGTLSSFVGAVKFPTGVRHDLGLYDSLVAFLLFAIFVLLFPRFVKKGWGYVMQYSVLCYAVARFFLDFLRASDLPGSDVRYAHLTPAQWGMLIFALCLTFLLIYGNILRAKLPNKQ